MPEERLDTIGLPRKQLCHELNEIVDGIMYILTDVDRARDWSQAMLEVSPEKEIMLKGRLAQLEEVRSNLQIAKSHGKELQLFHRCTREE